MMTKLLHLLILQSMCTGFILFLNFFFFFFKETAIQMRTLSPGHQDVVTYRTLEKPLPFFVLRPMVFFTQGQPDQQERGSALNGKSSTQPHICSKALIPWKQLLPLRPNTLSHSLCFMNRVWLKGEPAHMGQRRKKEGLVSQGTRQKKKDMVAWDKGEDLTKQKGSEIQ